MAIFKCSLSPCCVALTQPFGTLGWSWNVRKCYISEGVLCTRTRAPENRSGSVPPSLLWLITNIVGTARDQSL